jgi:RNA polymerase sigma-70 factor (ECF subfamily)
MSTDEVRTRQEPRGATVRCLQGPVATAEVHEVELDEALAGAREGDEESFLVLWRSYQPRLLRYLRVLSVPDVDDIASETWLQVVRDLKRFRGDSSSFAAWLFTIARRRTVDAQRARHRRPTVLVDLREEFTHRGAPEPAAEETALDGLSTRSALTTIAALPADQAEAVALSVIGGLTAAEIAEIVGISPGAVRVRTHRGLRRLQASLASRTEGETA